MTDEPSPYAAPHANIAPPLPTDQRLRLPRLFGWMAALWFAPTLIGLLSGLSMTNWEVYGATIEDAVENARDVRRLVILTLTYALYVAFLHGTATRRVAQAAVLYGLVELARAAEDLLVWRKPLEAAVDPIVSLLHAATVLLALATVAVLAARSRTR